MTDSTLAHEATIPAAPKGHDTAALGPSDSSDTGSDIAGAPGIDSAELAGDSDREGTGERGAVGHDAAPPNDALLHVDDGAPLDAEEIADDGNEEDVAD